MDRIITWLAHKFVQYFLRQNKALNDRLVSLLDTNQKFKIQVAAQKEIMSNYTAEELDIKQAITSLGLRIANLRSESAKLLAEHQVESHRLSKR